MHYIEFIANNPWTYTSVGLLIDIIGFVILMAELSAAQKSEFRIYNSDLIAGIDIYRKELLNFLERLNNKLHKVVKEDLNPYQCFRELLKVYFSDIFSRESFDDIVREFEIQIEDENEIGIVDHINYCLALKEARSAVSEVLSEGSIEGLSDIEKKWFSEWYVLPEFDGYSVLNWYQDESWVNKKPNWLSDENVYFRDMNFRMSSLNSRRTRFRAGAILVILGFVILLCGTLLTAFT
jgi:hypothetical protein